MNPPNRTTDQDTSPRSAATLIAPRRSPNAKSVTLKEIYSALGSPSLLAIGNRTQAPGCLVERAVNVALNQAFEDAEALLLARLGEVTLAALSADVRHQEAISGNTTSLESAHVS